MKDLYLCGSLKKGEPRKKYYGRWRVSHFQKLYIIQDHIEWCHGYITWKKEMNSTIYIDRVLSSLGTY